MIICKECQQYMEGGPDSYYRPICGHPECRDRVTGEQLECSSARICRLCGDEGKYFKAKEEEGK